MAKCHSGKARTHNHKAAGAWMAWPGFHMRRHILGFSIGLMQVDFLSIGLKLVDFETVLVLVPVNDAGP